VNPASLSILVNSPLTIDPSWALVEEGFSLAREHEIESICTVADGYVGTRGSLAEGSILSSPATFLAGVFDSRDGSAASLALVALPDWTQFRILGDRVPLALEAGEILEHRRILDLQHGLLFRTWRHRLAVVWNGTDGIISGLSSAPMNTTRPSMTMRTPT